MSIELIKIYEDGKLKRAVTRGDGYKGDEVTNNVRTIKTVPLQIPENTAAINFEVRGEIILPFAGFEKMNNDLIEIILEPYTRKYGVKLVYGGSYDLIEIRLFWTVK